MTDDDVLARYQLYLRACNERRWDQLAEYVGAQVMVNGQIRPRTKYIGDIQSTVRVFPDYRWLLTRAVRQGEWLAVHLVDTGTRREAFLGAAGDGSSVETDEFNMYRIVDGLIIEVEGTADNERLTR